MTTQAHIEEQHQPAPRLFDVLRMLTGIAAAILAPVSFGLAAWYFSVEGVTTIDAAVFWLGVGGLALWLVRAQTPDDLRVMAAQNVRTRARLLPLVTGGVLLALLAEINGDLLRPAFLDGVHYHGQFALLLVGVGLVGWGAAGRLRAGMPIHRQEAVALALICLLALAVRLWGLDSAVRLFIDEVHFANPITHFNDADDVELLLPFSSVAAFPYLYPYLQWHAAEFAGYTLVGLRLVSAVFGVLTVGAVYLLARTLFDRKTALIAAALLASFPPHLQYSRIGLNNIVDPFFGTLALYFVARGLRYGNRRGHFACAGVALGLTQYWYEGGRLLFPALMIGWLVMLGVVFYAATTFKLALARHKIAQQHILRAAYAVDVRRWTHALLWLALTALMVAAPVYYTLLGEGKGLIPRLETAGIGGDERFIVLNDADDLLAHVRGELRDALLFHLSVPEDALYYAGDTALILGFLLPFVFAGVLWCVWHPRPGAVLLLVWVGLSIGGNLLMQNSRISARYVVSFPALMLLAALGVRVLVDSLLVSGRPRRLLTVGLVTVLVVLQVNYFFTLHLPRFNDQFRDRLGLDSHDMLFRAADLPAGTTAIMIGEAPMPGRDATEFMRYLNDEIYIYTAKTSEFDAQAITALVPAADHAFFVDPDDVTTLLRLNVFFPAMQGPFYSPYAVPLEHQYALYYVPGTG